MCSVHWFASLFPDVWTDFSRRISKFLFFCVLFLFLSHLDFFSHYHFISGFTVSQLFCHCLNCWVMFIWNIKPLTCFLKKSLLIEINHKTENSTQCNELLNNLEEFSVYCMYLTHLESRISQGCFYKQMSFLRGIVSPKGQTGK